MGELDVVLDRFGSLPITENGIMSAFMVSVRNMQEMAEQIKSQAEK